MYIQASVCDQFETSFVIF